MSKLDDSESPGGFDYEVSSEQLREYRKLSPADRLRWLYAANDFLWRFTPPRNRRIWEALREGRDPFAPDS